MVGSGRQVERQTGRETNSWVRQTGRETDRWVKQTGRETGGWGQTYR